MPDLRFMRAVGLAAMLSAAPAGAADWPASLGYVLQADELAEQRAGVVSELAASGRDLLVLDAAFGVGEHGAWTREELDAVRAGAAGRRVVSYLSIGEAEDYRDYFPGLAGSELLLAENPHWKGNFKVRYWREDWQRLMAARAATLMEQGFDGVYLDIVDAYQHFEHDAQGAFHPGRINPETGETYRTEMVRFVRRIASAVRGVRADAIVIPQNGSDLLHDATYRAAVNGIGLEDLFTRNDAPQDAAHTRQVLDNLAALHGTPHFVLVIEYAGSGKERAHALQRAGELGYVLLLTDRALRMLGTSYAPMNWTERRPR